MQLSAAHLLFVIIIIIALCADTLTIPVAIGLIMAALLLFAGLGAMCVEGAEAGAEAVAKAVAKAGAKAGASKVSGSAESSAAAHDDIPDYLLHNNFYEEVPWQNQSVLNYPQSSIEHQALNTSYGTCYEPSRPVFGSSGAEIDNTVDANLSLLAQKRQRDKKAADGWALKDADYFRHNYDWELDDYENKPWWGRAEY